MEYVASTQPTSNLLRIWRQQGLKFSVAVGNNPNGMGVFVAEVKENGVCFQQARREIREDISSGGTTRHTMDRC
jgi:hypothetical protein